MERKSQESFTRGDLEDWADAGLITRDQLARISAHLSPSRESDNSRTEEEQKGLSFVTVAYYFGGFMILLAYTIFMGIQWESLPSASRVGAVAIPIVLLWILGAFLRRNGFPGAGGVLVFAGTGIVPLLIYTLEGALNLWPEYPKGSDRGYQDFYRTVASLWVYMELPSLVIGLEVLRRVKFPLITLLIGVWSWFLSMDVVRWVIQSHPGSWGDTEQIAGILLGLGMLLLGAVLMRRTRQDYSVWFFIIGHMAVLTHFSVLAASREGVLGLLYLGLYLLFVVASVLLQRRVFLVFGALGCYSYASYLAFKVFAGSMGFVYTLATLGLVTVITAVGYQRYVRGWLERKLLVDRS